MEDRFVVSPETGQIVNNSSGGSFIGGDAVNMEEKIIAPGYLELQTNGMNGFHFSSFTNQQNYQKSLTSVSDFLVTKGVTGFWATLPSVPGELYRKVICDTLSDSSKKLIDLDFTAPSSTRIFELCILTWSACRRSFLVSR